MSKRQPVKRQAKGHSPLKIRLFVLAVVIGGCAVAIPLLFERDALPENIRESRAVASLYETRDRVIRVADRALHGAPLVTEEEKQTGYPKDDRHKLEAIINKGAQDH